MAVAMSAEPIILRNRHWTVDDLDELPQSDGNRYEIIDGALVVSGAPGLRHQRAVLRLAMLLVNACPAEYEVLVAPFGVVLSDDTMIMPDVLVARVADLTEGELPGAPVLAVEVMSKSSHVVDLNLKPDRLARAGTQHYWVVTPSTEPDKARLRAWRLVDGRYRLTADVSGTQAYPADTPYPVTVVPADLVR
jgi:Uma2 family endonuclease